MKIIVKNCVFKKCFFIFLFYITIVKEKFKLKYFIKNLKKYIWGGKKYEKKNCKYFYMYAAVSVFLISHRK